MRRGFSHGAIPTQDSMPVQEMWEKICGGVDIDFALRLEPIQRWSGAGFLAKLGSKNKALEGGVWARF